MLTDALVQWLTIHLKKIFIGKEREKKKKKKDILTIFSISHKTCVKTFLKYIVNY